MKLKRLMLVLMVLTLAVPACVLAEETLPAAPTAIVTLKNGDMNGEVVRLQARLKELGYDPGVPDGKFGTSTENAVRAFQKDNGLAVDGKAGAKTLEKLYSQSVIPIGTTPTPVPSSTTLKNGDENSEVARLQAKMKELGYYHGETDGKFGTSTENAVRAFQKAHKLAVDGMAGAKTLEAIYNSQPMTPTPRPTATPKPTVAPKPTVTPDPYASPTPGYHSNTWTRYLSLRSTGTDVRQLQNRLIELGWMTGKADGIYGGATEAAVKAFQKANQSAGNKIWVDGVVGPDTDKALYAEEAVTTEEPVTCLGVSISEGDSGAAVTVIQKKLKEIGYYNGPISGVYESDTIAAVKAFQISVGQRSSGSVTNQMLNALFLTNAK